MIITDIQLVEINDFTFKCSFLVDGHNLVSNPIPRKSTKEEVQEEISKTVNAWLTERADENFNQLKEQFEGKVIEL